ncbi:MAG: energy transducer TonB [Terracidiphilus sp.]
MNAPTTLPADFGEWDSGDNTAAQPASVSGFDDFPASGVAPKPVAKSTTARVAVLPVAAKPPAAAPRKPAPTYAEAEPVYQQPKRTAPAKHKVESEDKPKKTGMFAAVGAVAVLLVAGVLVYPHLHSGTSTPKPAVAPQSAAATTALSTTTTIKPSPSTQTTVTPSANTDTTTADNTVRANTELMNHQLTAPSKISSDLKMLAGKDAAAAPASGFGAPGMDGLGNAGSGVFAGQSGPKVKVAAPQKVSISSGIAVGLLIQRTTPIYPPMAKNARVSGTVVIQATISRNGTIENPRVVSGPAMLRQSALDAVKSWRYRPYMLSGEPVEVETTVNVNFSLGG